MKAIVVKHAGGPEALEYTEVPTPEVKPGWTRIKVRGFGINHSEIFTREGDSPSVKFPRILGIEAVGEVDETSLPDKFKSGQKVVSIMGGMGREFDGGYAEYALLPNTQIYPVTTNLSWPELAAVPETYYTAYGAVRSLQMKPGQRVLIRAATSGVGVAAAKLIRGYDPDTEIVGTTRSSTKTQQLQDHGFDRVIVTPDATKLPDTAGDFDKILDLIGPPSVRDSLLHLRRYGILNVTGELGGEWTIPDFDPITEIPNDRYLTGFGSDEAPGPILQELLDFIAQHHIDVHPAKVFDLPETAQAHAYLESGNSLGKLVVLP